MCNPHEACVTQKDRLKHSAQICQETGKEQEVQVLGAADKTASLGRCKSSCRQLPVRTASISDAQEGNALCSARTYTPRLPSAGGYCGGSDLGGSKPRGLNMSE